MRFGGKVRQSDDRVPLAASLSRTAGVSGMLLVPRGTRDDLRSFSECGQATPKTASDYNNIKYLYCYTNGNPKCYTRPTTTLASKQIGRRS